MSSCILCLDVLRKSKKVQLNEEVIEGKSVHQAIEQQFAQHYHLLHGPSSHSQCICKSCHSSLQIFYDFVNIINLKHNFPQVRIKSEKVEHEEPENAISFINFTDEQPVDLKELEINITRIKAEPDFDYDITQDPQLPTDDKSDFEWELDEEQMKIFNEIPEPLETKEPDKKKKRKPSLSDSDFEISKPSTRNSRKKSKSKPDPQKPKKVCGSDDRIRKFCGLDCGECGIELESFRMLRKHFREHHQGIKQYILCCGKKFHRRCMALDHINSRHDDSVEFKCHICNKKYSTARTVEKHIEKIHLNIRRPEELMTYVCSECGMVLRSVAILRCHMLKHEVDETKTFECYICKKDHFKNLQLLKIHITYAHNLKRPKKKKCTICSKEVLNLPAHMTARHSEKPPEREKCKICGNWVKSVAMKNHIQKHSLPSAQCKICLKTFKSVSLLNVHNKLVHLDLKRNFQCTTCDKAFFKEIKLREHVAAAHTREYLFKCRVPGCGKEFRAQGNWKMHEKRAHPEEYEKIFKPFYKRGPDDPPPVDVEEALINLNEENLMNNFYENGN